MTHPDTNICDGCSQQIDLQYEAIIWDNNTGMIYHSRCAPPELLEDETDETDDEEMWEFLDG